MEYAILSQSDPTNRVRRTTSRTLVVRRSRPLSYLIRFKALIEVYLIGTFFSSFLCAMGRCESSCLRVSFRSSMLN